MLSLKEAIVEVAVQVQHKIKAFKAMISANLNSVTFPHGLLTSTQEQYESCMSIDPQKLTELLEQDLSVWRENALSRTQLVTNKLETFLEKQTHLVQGFVQQQEFGLIEKSKKLQSYDFELSKLPLFGQKLQPNFEFPKKENFKPPVFSIEKMMDLKVKLCEVAFKRRAVGNELQGI